MFLLRRASYRLPFFANDGFRLPWRPINRPDLAAMSQDELTNLILAQTQQVA